jgi:hypothetical protein
VTADVNLIMALGANGAILLGSYGIARYGFGEPHGLDTTLATALLYWVACLLGLEALGTVGALAVGPMLAFGLIVGATGWGLRWFRIGAERDARPRAMSEPLSWDAVVALALVLSAALVLGTRSLLLGVKVVSDGPIYHLYFAARWWKAGRVFLIASPFGESAATYFPANGDLWFAWLMTSWGSDRLAKVGQAPFLLLAGLAAYATARALGTSRSAGVVATCWFLSSTPLLIFTFEPNVDTIFVAAYLMAAYFFLRASRSGGDTAGWFLGSLAAGAALGTKAVGIVFVPPLIGIALMVVLVQPVPKRTRFNRAVVIVVAPLISGGFWYIRNAVLTGNPLYPLTLRLFGRTFLSGWYLPEAMKSSPYYLPVTDWRALGDIMLAVLDPRLAPFWIASVLTGWVIKNPDSEKIARRVGMFSVMAVLNVGLYWICIPYRTQQRFMFQAVGLAVVPLAFTLDRSRWLLHAGVVLLAVHFFTPQGWPSGMRDGDIFWDLTPLIPNAVSDPLSTFSRIGTALQPVEIKQSPWPVAILVGVVVSAAFAVWASNGAFSRSYRSSRRGYLTTILVSSIVFVSLGYADVWRPGLDSRLTFYPMFPDFLQGWLALESRSGSAGARVAYTGTNIPYYLFGQGLRNEVCYVNINRHREWLMHDYHRDAMARGEGTWPNSRPGWDRSRPEYQAWLDNLDAEGIQLIVITRVNPQEGAHNAADRDNFPVERRWAEDHPDRFEPLYGPRENDPWFRLFRLRRPGSLSDRGVAIPRPRR